MLIVGAIRGDDDKLTRVADFDNGFGNAAVERFATDDELCFSRFDVALAFGDLPVEDDCFEVNDREFVIVKFLCGVRGYDIANLTKMRERIRARS